MKFTLKHKKTILGAFKDKIEAFEQSRLIYKNKVEVNMVEKSKIEKFADSIIGLIEDPAHVYSDEYLGRYVRLLYRRFRLGFDDYYSDGELDIYH